MEDKYFDKWQLALRTLERFLSAVSYIPLEQIPDHIREPLEKELSQLRSFLAEHYGISRKVW